MKKCLIFLKEAIKYLYIYRDVLKVNTKIKLFKVYYFNQTQIIK